MKMNTQKIRMAVMLLLCVLLAPLSLQAQNVTVHPGNGSMMPALKSGNTDTFYGWGGFATWKHEQLSLTMTTGDSDNNLTDDSNQLTGSGQLAKPANNIFASAADANGNKYLQIGKGRSSRVNNQAVGLDTYLTIALPKGYRFTGYTIKFHRISAPNGLPSGTRSQNWSGNINFGETNNAFTYISTTNTTDNNITTYRGGIGQNNTTVYTISRTSDTDMDNVLYFKLDNGRQYSGNSNSTYSGRCFIQLDFVELYFTAEHNTPTLIPAQTATNVSAVDIPFTTSKIDYGQLVMRDINGVAQGSSGYQSSSGRMSYDGTIRDMNANMILYEEGSVKKVTSAENDFDGTEGYMVDTHSGSISSAGEYFKLESSKHVNLNDDGEAIYYIESPVWAVNTAAANPHKNPIGYRIVSAIFNYAAGTGDTYLPATFKIQYESVNHGPDQNGTYGLNTYSQTYNWNPSYHTVWRIDQEGYIYGYNTANGDMLYLSVNGTNIVMTTTKPSAAVGTFDVVDNDGVSQIRLKSDETKYIGWREEVDGTYVDDNGQPNDNVTRYVEVAADAGHRSTYNEVSAASTAAHGAYTLKIYEPDGVTAKEEIEVSDEGGTIEVTGYNNDAIKIGVVGTALINGQVTMQALDPYIDRLDIVCQESGGTGGKLTQQFSATDFAVKGGKFTFYVPTGFPAPAKFTFENLYSHYGDETYYNTPSTNHARYFFVKSPYEQTAANVYNRNNADSYTTKILTEKVGSTKFTFNNASTVGSAGGWFEEYAFSPSKYTGSFNDFTFNQTEMSNGTIKTAYLFTCDEPRYNIAPTTATQHLYYAFYEMTVDMQSKTYEPILTWNKVYDETYDGSGKTDSKWGLTLTTTETVDDHGRHSGYLTVTQILDKIGQRTGNNTVAGGPTNTDQILFVDGSKLMSIVENQTSTGTGSNITYTSHPKSELMNVLDKNALIYLPYGSKSSDDNFAFNTIEDYTKSPIFRGANNFVMTDKYAFYAPYDIQVDAAKMAYYERKISKDSYGKVQNATLIMPFKLNLEGGTHTNEDGTYFTLHKMQASQSIELQGGKPYAYFPNEVADVTVTDPHTPYMVRLDEKNTNDEQDYSFVVSENGTLIKATTGASVATTSDGYNYYYVGETSTGTVAAGGTYPGGSYTLTNQGTYAGQAIDKTKGVFYFARDRFVNSAELASSISTVKIYPFRSYYKVSGSAKSFSTMNVIFGQNDNDIEDAIRDLQEKQMDMSLRTGKGTLTITSAIDNMVRIIGINGVSHYNLNLSAGETKTVSVPAGIYIVNGAKILVK